MTQIRASQIRATEISSNHRELHGAIFSFELLVIYTNQIDNLVNRTPETCVYCTNILPSQTQTARQSKSLLRSLILYLNLETTKILIRGFHIWARCKFFFDSNALSFRSAQFQHTNFDSQVCIGTLTHKSWAIQLGSQQNCPSQL